MTNMPDHDSARLIGALPGVRDADITRSHSAGKRLDFRSIRTLGDLGSYFDGWSIRLALQCHRLIGLSVLRIILSIAAVMYYISDYGRRHALWGTNSFMSPDLAQAGMGQGLFLLYVFSDSRFWFELLFHGGIVIAVLFGIFGGRLITFLHAVFLWSLYNRNGDLLEGGDNLARILLIFMILTVNNAYFSPGAKVRRSRLVKVDRPKIPFLLHNVGVVLIVFQVVVLYFTAGYQKIAGEVWRNGVAMYYISHINVFNMFDAYSAIMSNPFVTTGVSYFTIIIEMGLPFVMLSNRSWLRKLEIVALEALHIGIMVSMGLVCFGLIMIGADFILLRDNDYRQLSRRFSIIRRSIGGRRGDSIPGTEMSQVRANDRPPAVEATAPVAVL
jgi:hypothetical protein